MAIVNFGSFRLSPCSCLDHLALTSSSSSTGSNHVVMSTVSASCGNSTLIYSNTVSALWSCCSSGVNFVSILCCNQPSRGRLWSSSVHIFLHDNYDIEHLETILEVSREHCSWNHLAFGLLALLYSVMSILHSDCAGRVSISPSVGANSVGIVSSFCNNCVLILQ